MAGWLLAGNCIVAEFADLEPDDVETWLEFAAHLPSFGQRAIVSP
jgi:hypothetical protein